MQKISGVLLALLIGLALTGCTDSSVNYNPPLRAQVELVI